MTHRGIGHVLPFAIALGACGLFPPEPGGDEVPSDGAGAFGASAPVEICLGSARVVSAAASAGAGAVCVRDGASPKACAAGTECDGIEQCTCGRCVVRACQGATSCGTGLVCRGRRCTTPCSADSECAGGERCVAGGCSRACSNDAECHHGEQCDALDSVCSSKLCSAALSCGSGEACEAQELIAEAREPDLAPPSIGAYAFVEIRRGGASAIHRVRVDAPLRFTADPVEPVLEPEAGELVGGPSSFDRGGRLELYFHAATAGGSSIGRAVSTDGGRTFARDATPVLAPSEPWEAGRVASPSAFSRAGGDYLAYEGGARAGIGIARLDGAVAARLGGGPVISPGTLEDPLFWRSISAVGAPAVVVTGDVVRIYFGARGAEASDALGPAGALPADVNDSIGMVATRDLVRFDRFPTGPVLARVANLRAFLGELEPAVRLGPAGAEAYFVGADASGANVTGVSRAGPAPAAAP